MNLLLWKSRDKNCWHQLIVPHLLISSSRSVKPSVRSMSLWSLLSHCSFSSFFNHYYYYFLILLYLLNDLKSKQTFPALACLYPALGVAQANECSRASQWEEGWKGGGWNLRRQIHHREGRRRLAGQPVNTWQHNRGRGREKKISFCCPGSQTQAASGGGTSGWGGEWGGAGWFRRGCIFKLVQEGRRSPGG